MRNLAGLVAWVIAVCFRFDVEDSVAEIGGAVVAAVVVGFEVVVGE